MTSNLKIPPMRREKKNKEEGVANYGLDIMEEVEDNYESG